MIGFLRMPFARGALCSAIMIVALVPVGGCAGVVDRSWSEEVELEGGQVITIDRYVKFQESSSIAGDVHSSVDLESSLK
jgi:hypothetical protein